MVQSRERIMSMIEDQIYQKSKLLSELNVGMQDLRKDSITKFLDLVETKRSGAEFSFGIDTYPSAKSFSSIDRRLLTAILKMSGHTKIVTEKDAGFYCKVILTDIKDSTFSFECKIQSYLHSFFGLHYLDHYIVYDGSNLKFLRDMLEEYSYNEIVSEFAEINGLKTFEVPNYFCQVDSRWGGIDTNEEALRYIESDSDAVDFFISQKDDRQKLYMLLQILKNDGYLITEDNFVSEFDESFVFELELEISPKRANDAIIKSVRKEAKSRYRQECSAVRNQFSAKLREDSVSDKEKIGYILIDSDASEFDAGLPRNMYRKVFFHYKEEVIDVEANNQILHDVAKFSIYEAQIIADINEDAFEGYRSCVDRTLIAEYFVYDAKMYTSLTDLIADQ